jgi:hypothetical protein
LESISSVNVDDVATQRIRRDGRVKDKNANHRVAFKGLVDVRVRIKYGFAYSLSRVRRTRGAVVIPGDGSVHARDSQGIPNLMPRKELIRNVFTI